MKKLAILFVALNALDIGLTLHFVGNGTSTELNPIMVKILALPLPIILLYKIVLPAILVTALIGLNRFQIVRRKINMKLILVLLVGGEIGICLFNLTGLIWS
ncbi:MAG: DUF5658 family protein [Dehalococcoidales bacterium]|nr:DUF5658 family protein [Dehalococcoidales bacterium]